MIYFWGKIPFVLDFLARDIANHSYAPNTPFTDVLNPLNTEILPTLLSLDHLYSPDYFAGLCWTRLQNSRFFFSKSVKKSVKRGAKSASLSLPQSRSLFSASFQTFCLTARACLNTQKYGQFCSLQMNWKELTRDRLKWCSLISEGAEPVDKEEGKTSNAQIPLSHVAPHRPLLTSCASLVQTLSCSD